MVVGRGYTADTSGKEAETTSIIDAKGSTKGTALKKELNKAPETLSPKEGDPDMKNDRSRIVLSQRTYVNKNFGIDAYNGQLAIEGVDDDLAGEPAITIKSDKIRLIARSDVQFIVTGFEAATTENKKLMKSELSVTGSNGRINWSSITMKSNGDIIFTPSDDGYVRLGGPDANLGIVCSDQPVTTTNGGVSGKPLKTTMGGAFAGAVAAPDGKSNKKSLNANGQGKYANKVLIK